jgi:hypothetical protein
MKNAFSGRLWPLFLFVTLLTSSLFADSPGVLYPEWGTTLDGKAVYYSVLIVAGSEIKTADVGSMITFGGAELEIAPNSTLVVGDPFIASCGTIVIRRGTAQISDGKSTVTLTLGDPDHSSFYCDNTLPDAPSAVRSAHERLASKQFRRSGNTPIAASTGGPLIYSEVMNWSYWTVTGAMLSSSLVSVDLTHKCLEVDACTFLPDAFHRRRVMYGAGLPAVTGISYLSYYLKSKHYPWWFVPAAVVTAGNIVISVHAAHYSH